ncbi:hypothetical protein ANCCAN_09586 [Ancylostoma caninum]|uniref:Uncharacterized protein n=1 Tax=Ancylostoma caninum TaxID=29170 RepID=A0A368GMD2_ANCCA|nr:hypothetical protein ANCCAN_09586 [Ancylostoma caninum]
METVQCDEDFWKVNYSKQLISGIFTTVEAQANTLRKSTGVDGTYASIMFFFTVIVSQFL